MSIILSQTGKFLREFIKLYRQHECLWKKDCMYYLHNNKRREAYDVLYEKLLEVDKNCTRRHVKTKIAGLRMHFFKELKKLEESMKKGENYEPNLWYFNELSFIALRDIPKVKEKDDKLSDVRYWSPTFAKEFISIYKANKCLWETKSPDFRCQEVKLKAYEELRQKLLTIDQNATIEIVKRRIYTLRANFKYNYINFKTKTKSEFKKSENHYIFDLMFLKDQFTYFLTEPDNSSGECDSPNEFKVYEKMDIENYRIQSQDDEVLELASNEIFIKRETCDDDKDDFIDQTILDDVEEIFEIEDDDDEEGSNDQTILDNVEEIFEIEDDDDEEDSIDQTILDNVEEIFEIEDDDEEDFIDKPIQGNLDKIIEMVARNSNNTDVLEIEKEKAINQTETNSELTLYTITNLDDEPISNRRKRTRKENNNESNESNGSKKLTKDERYEDDKECFIDGTVLDDVEETFEIASRNLNNKDELELEKEINQTEINSKLTLYTITNIDEELISNRKKRTRKEINNDGNESNGSKKFIPEEIYVDDEEDFIDKPIQSNLDKIIEMVARNVNNTDELEIKKEINQTEINSELTLYTITNIDDEQISNEKKRTSKERKNESSDSNESEKLIEGEIYDLDEEDFINESILLDDAGETFNISSRNLNNKDEMVKEEQKKINQTETNLKFSSYTKTKKDDEEIPNKKKRTSKESKNESNESNGNEKLIEGETYDCDEEDFIDKPILDDVGETFDIGSRNLNNKDELEIEEQKKINQTETNLKLTAYAQPNKDDEQISNRKKRPGKESDNKSNESNGSKSKQTKKVTNIERSQNISELVTEKLIYNEDECDTYGKYIANEMRMLLSKDRPFLQKIFNDALFEARLGNATKLKLTREN